MALLIGRQWRGDPEFLAQATMAPPPTPPAVSHDFARQDWGLAIGVCFLVLTKLWQMVNGQISDDSALNKELIKSVMEQNKILMTALLERKT
jgi:hypothetical protein